MWFSLQWNAAPCGYQGLLSFSWNDDLQPFVGLVADHERGFVPLVDLRH